MRRSGTGQRGLRSTMLVLSSLAWIPVACESTPSSPTDAPTWGAARPPLDFDQIFQRDHVLRVSIDMAPQDWESLRLEHPPQGFGPFGAACHPFNHAFRYGYRPATVIVDGRRLTNVGVRKKAYCGSEDQDKPGLIVAFDKYSPQSLGAGIRRMTLNNAVQDPSYVRQCLGMMVFERAGTPSSRCNFAAVTVNGGEPELYVHVEPLRAPYLERHFEWPDGPLYEGTLSDFHPDWLPQFELKTTPNSDVGRVLERASAALVDESVPALDRVAAHFDLEETMRYWAVEVVMAAWDGYHSNQNNFFVYGDPQTERLTFLPWGLDHVLSNVNAPAARADAWLSYQLYGDALAQPRFYAALDEVLGDAWDEKVILAELDRIARLIEPHLLEGETEDVADALEHTRTFVRDRRASMATQLADGPLALDLEPPKVPSLVELGRLETTFDTHWNTLGQDAAGTGVSTVAGGVEDFDLDIARSGALAGASGETGRIMLGFELASGDYLQLFAVGPAKDLIQAAVIEPNYSGRWRGGLSHRPAGSDSLKLVARLIDATLRLDVCDSEDGGVVSGALAGRIVRVE